MTEEFGVPGGWEAGNSRPLGWIDGLGLDDGFPLMIMQYFQEVL